MSHETAPVPSRVASTVLTNTFTCVAASPIVPGPISMSMRRSPSWRQSSSGAYEKPSRRSSGHCSAICATPPSSAPTAIAVMGGSPSRGITGTSSSAERIVAMLNIAGASAGTKKRCSELSMPIITAAIATSVRNGNTMRVSRTVSSSFPGTAA